MYDYLVLPRQSDRARPSFPLLCSAGHAYSHPAGHTYQAHAKRRSSSAGSRIRRIVVQSIGFLWSVLWRKVLEFCTRSVYPYLGFPVQLSLKKQLPLKLALCSSW